MGDHPDFKKRQPSPRGKRWKGDGAFTLLELLVVVAIISLLAALLLPSLKNARETAKSAICISNLRQIYAAVRMYADDNNDCFPTPITWFRLLGDGHYVGSPGPLFSNTTNWGWTASYRRWPVFQCPAEKGVWYSCSGVPDKVSTVYDSDLDNCSYDHNWSMNWYAYYSTSPPRKWSQPVECPGGVSAAWLYIDCQAYSSPGWYWNYREWGIDSNTDQVKYAFRHPGGRANVVCMDGHCSTLRHVSVTGKSNWSTTDPTSGNPIWNDAPP